MFDVKTFMNFCEFAATAATPFFSAYLVISGSARSLQPGNVPDSSGGHQIEYETERLSRRLPPPPCRNRRCAPTVGVRRSSTTLDGGMLCAPTAAQCWKKTSLSRRSVSRRRVAVHPPSSDSLSLLRVSHCLAFRPADLMCLVRKGWI